MVRTFPLPKRIPSRSTGSLAIIGILIAASAEPAAGASPAEQQSLDAFANANATCTAWSDGCIVCKRQGGKDYVCSTQGIACRPSGLACQDADPGKGAR